jgi:hypothetical protein
MLLRELSLGCSGMRRHETHAVAAVNRWVAGSSPARGANKSKAFNPCIEEQIGAGVQPGFRR